MRSISSDPVWINPNQVVFITLLQRYNLENQYEVFLTTGHSFVLSLDSMISLGLVESHPKPNDLLIPNQLYKRLKVLERNLK